MYSYPRRPSVGHGRRGLRMWALGSLVYFVAIFHRTSLGVASGLAQERFRIGPAELSMFTAQQLIAAAAMQLPAGLLADRFGARRILTAALFLMAAGQGAFAVIHDVPLGLAARMLLGLGDASTFICVLRLTASWCAEKRIALLVLLTSVLGMAGNVVSITPLRMALEEFGWTPTFLGVALVTAALGCLVFGVVRDAPGGDVRPSGTPVRGRFGDVTAVWRERGTKLGFWMNFTSTCSFMAFALLWGFPFLTKGQGMSAASAGHTLVLLVIANMVAGPVYGHIASTKPAARVRVNTMTTVVVALLWAVVLGWPGAAPHPLVALLVMAMGICGPASLLGVDVARTSNPRKWTATAAAMANIGGHAGTIAAVSVVGVGLSAAEGAGVAEPAAFTMAFTAQWSLFVLGGLQIFRHSKESAQHPIRPAEQASSS